MQLWMEPTSHADFPMADDSKHRWIYTCALYKTPIGGSAMPGRIVSALNTYESRNSETSASGYSIDTRESPPCGAIIGVEPIPSHSNRYPLGSKYLIVNDYAQKGHLLRVHRSKRPDYQADAVSLRLKQQAAQCDGGCCDDDDGGDDTLPGGNHCNDLPTPADPYINDRPATAHVVCDFYFHGSAPACTPRLFGHFNKLYNQGGFGIWSSGASAIFYGCVEGIGWRWQIIFDAFSAPRLYDLGPFTGQQLPPSGAATPLSSGGDCPLPWQGVHVTA